MIEYRDYITRTMLRTEPDVLFVFGDNLQRRGLGGQAKEMRGENNAIGIPTKAAPNMTEAAFLSDGDFDRWARQSGYEICLLLAHEGKIVWPAAGIGTGLAQLRKHAPTIWRAIERLRLALETSERSAALKPAQSELSDSAPGERDD